MPALDLQAVRFGENVVVVRPQKSEEVPPAEMAGNGSYREASNDADVKTIKAEADVKTIKAEVDVKTIKAEPADEGETPRRRPSPRLRWFSRPIPPERATSRPSRPQTSPACFV
jgi:hypothetical protein